MFIIWPENCGDTPPPKQMLDYFRSSAELPEDSEWLGTATFSHDDHEFICAAFLAPNEFTDNAIRIATLCDHPPPEDARPPDSVITAYHHSIRMFSERLARRLVIRNHPEAKPCEVAVNLVAGVEVGGELDGEGSAMLVTLVGAGDDVSQIDVNALAAKLQAAFDPPERMQ